MTSAAGASTSFKVKLVVGLLLIVAGLAINRRAFDAWGHDFAPQYMSAWLLREGKNVYDFTLQRDGYMRHVGSVTTWAHFHPPGAAVIALPATVLPYAAAREVWFVLAVAIMLVGLWRFMTVYLSHWDASDRFLVLGLVMCAATTRWGFKVAQPGSIVLGMFALFLTFLKFERGWLALLTGGVVAAMKVTFGIPFFLLALAQRRYGLTVAMGTFVVVINLIGLFGMGGPAILKDYRANFAEFERADQLNYPDPRGANSLARTDWAYLLNAIDPNFARNNLLALCLTLASVGWLAWLVWNANVRGDTASLALTGPLAAISMLAVYHHHYDMGILLLPVLAYVGRPELRRLSAVPFYVIPVVAYAGLYPIEKVNTLATSLLGPSSVLVTKPLACVVCIVAFVSSMLIFQSIVRPVGVRNSSLAAGVQ
jgi:glycosyl transferase family 87